MLMAKLDLVGESQSLEDKTNKVELFDINRVIQVAIAGLKVLIGQDREKKVGIQELKLLESSERLYTIISSG